MEGNKRFCAPPAQLAQRPLAEMAEAMALQGRPGSLGRRPRGGLAPVMCGAGLELRQRGALRTEEEPQWAGPARLAQTTTEDPGSSAQRDRMANKQPPWATPAQLTLGGKEVAGVR